MPKNYDFSFVDQDPHPILGVSDDATAEEIRTAYLAKIREYPPERCPEEFERIRDAYNVLSDPRQRTLTMLHSADPEMPLVKLLDNQKTKRRFVGPQAWLDAMMIR
jgi:preprotein translocase subunit Sec63